MNINWKIILSVIGLLLIGYVAGFNHHRYLMKNKIQRIADVRVSPDSPLADRFLERINASEEQKDQLRPIIKKHVKELHQIGQFIRDKRKPVLDSMRAEVEVHLNTDQKAEFEKLMQRISRPFGKGKRKKKPKTAGSN